MGAHAASRYVLTGKGGWLDLRHVYAVAARSLAPPSGIRERFAGAFVTIERVGQLVEEDQAREGHPSAFSFEDFPSNHQGILLAAALRGSKDARATILEFFGRLEPIVGTFEEAAPLADILNFSVEPIFVPADSSLKKSRHFVFKPSDDPTKDWAWFAMVEKGLAKNPEHSEVPTTPVESLVFDEVIRKLRGEATR